MTVHTILFVFASVIAGLALAATGYIALLAFVGLFLPPRSRFAPTIPTPETRFILLIPAHNEEKGIGPTLESVRAQRYRESLLRVIVIADNCSDQTAAEVRGAGFECWERWEPTVAGKGRALRWALDQLPSDTFDAVVFIDADSRIDPEFLAAMDREIQQGAVAVQGQYEFELADSSYFSLLTFASKLAENRLFWRPRERFGWMGFITGNGFCLKREVLESVPWSAYSIVEDVEYSIQLTLHGLRVRFAESARVVSRPTRRAADAVPQRLRWASGTLQVILNYVPKLLSAGIVKGSFRLLEMAVALLLTSRFLLIYLLLLAGAGSLILSASGGVLLLRAIIVASLLLQAGYLMIVFTQIPGTSGSRLRAFLALPFYLCWMFFVHAAAVIGVRRNAWIRTTR